MSRQRWGGRKESSSEPGALQTQIQLVVTRAL